MHVKSHNVLGAKDFFKRFSSPQLSKTNTASFMRKLLFFIKVALKTIGRPSKLHLQRLSQISEGSHKGSKCVSAKRRLGSVDWTCKAAYAAWKDSNVKQKGMTMFGEAFVLESFDSCKPPVSVNCFLTIKNISCTVEYCFA